MVPKYLVFRRNTRFLHISVARRMVFRVRSPSNVIKLPQTLLCKLPEIDTGGGDWDLRGVAQFFVRCFGE